MRRSVWTWVACKLGFHVWAYENLRRDDGTLIGSPEDYPLRRCMRCGRREERLGPGWMWRGG